jgi:hypothetical protein
LLRPVGQIDVRIWLLVLVLSSTDHGDCRFDITDDVLSILLASQRLIDLVALAILIAALTCGRSARTRAACATAQTRSCGGGWRLRHGGRGCIHGLADREAARRRCPAGDSSGTAADATAAEALRSDSEDALGRALCPCRVGVLEPLARALRSICGLADRVLGSVHR